MWKLPKSILIAVLLLPMACADSTRPLPGVQARADAQEADLADTDTVARLGAGLTGLVRDLGNSFGELGDAVGDLVPEEDNPCPGGGSASGDLGGSINHPKVRMQFYECVRASGEMLHGNATVVCDDFSGGRCRRGEATLGQDGVEFIFRNVNRSLQVQGVAQLVFDESARRLAAVLDLQGGFQTPQGLDLHRFRTQSLGVDLREVAEDSIEVLIEGQALFEGDVASADCAAGAVDAETLAPLLLVAQRWQQGELRLHAPPPRPGAQQALLRYVANGDMEVTDANGTQANIPAETHQGYCAPPRE